MYIVSVRRSGEPIRSMAATDVKATAVGPEVTLVFVDTTIDPKHSPFVASMRATVDETRALYAALGKVLGIP